MKNYQLQVISVRNPELFQILSIRNKLSLSVQKPVYLYFSFRKLKSAKLSGLYYILLYQNNNMPDNIFSSIHSLQPCTKYTAAMHVIHYQKLGVSLLTHLTYLIEN